MTTVENPTEEQIQAYCLHMQKALLEARERGDSIVLGYKALTKKVDDTPEYGRCLVDELYIGNRWRAETYLRGFER